MFRLTSILPRAPSLLALPAALALALMTTEFRIAIILTRDLPFHLLPSMLADQAAILADAILVSELTFLIVRLFLMPLGFILTDVMPASAAIPGKFVFIVATISVISAAMATTLRARRLRARRSILACLAAGGEQSNHGAHADA